MKNDKRLSCYIQMGGRGKQDAGTRKVGPGCVLVLIFTRKRILLHPSPLEIDLGKRMRIQQKMKTTPCEQKLLRGEKGEGGSM